MRVRRAVRCDRLNGGLQPRLEAGGGPTGAWLWERVAPLPARFQRLPWTVIAGHRVPVAERPVSRLLGLALLDRESAGPGLLIPCCRSVHTFGMRFPLDVIFLDREGTTICWRSAIPAGRVLFERRAAAVLELVPQPSS